MAQLPRLLSMSGGVFAGFLGLGIGLAQGSPALKDCLAECKRPGLSATNRASCRLDCENEAASDPEQIRAQMERRTAPTTPKTPAASGRTNKAPLGCKASCDADRSLSVDDRASCKLDCEQEALPVPGAPTAAKVPGAGGSRVAPLEAVPPTSPPSVPAPIPTQAGFLARCQATCIPGFGPREAADFETCKLDCETMASVLDVARGWVPDGWLAAPTPTVPVVPPPVIAAPPVVARVAVTSPTRSTTGPLAQGCGPALERCNAGCSKQEGACGRRCSGRTPTDRETCKLTCGTDREVCQGDCLSASATCLNNQAQR
jgi:hypothetical protein